MLASRRPSLTPTDGAGWKPDVSSGSFTTDSGAPKIAPCPLFPERDAKSDPWHLSRRVRATVAVTPCNVPLWLCGLFVHDGFSRMQLFIENRLVAKRQPTNSVPGVGVGGISIGNWLETGAKKTISEATCQNSAGDGGRSGLKPSP